MKVLKGIGTIIVLTVLCAALAMTLFAGLLRFMALNPDYVKSFMVSHAYCEEIRTRLSEDLDHIAEQYGVEEGALPKLVSDRAIRSYTNRLIDALYTQKDLSALTLPAYPRDDFEAYARANTSFSEEGVKDFSEDCAKAVDEKLSAINVPLITEGFQSLRDSTIAKYSLILFIAALILSLLMILFLRLMYLGESRRTGSVMIWGGCFMGTTLAFVPVLQFLLFGYVDRLRIELSVFRTMLTGFLNTILYGWFIVLAGLELLSLVLLIISLILSGRKKK